MNCNRTVFFKGKDWRIPAALLVVAFLIPAAEARPPEIIDLSAPEASSTLTSLSSASSDTWHTIYFEDFDDPEGGPDPAGWDTFSMIPDQPAQPSYWHHVLGNPVYYQTTFESSEFTHGLLDGQRFWTGSDGLGIPNDRVSVGPYAGIGADWVVEIDRTSQSGGGHNAGRSMPTSAEFDKVSLGISAQFTLGQPSYWTLMHVQLADNFVAINMDALNNLFVVFQGPISFPIGQIDRRLDWNRFEQVIDFEERSVAILLNGVEIWGSGPSGLAGIARRIQHVSFGGQGSSDDIGYFDDFVITDLGASGFWWCGIESICLDNPIGYGNRWNQRLVKTFSGVSAGAMLSLRHRFDTETDYDFCRVEVSSDAGATYQEIGSFDGASGEFIDSDISLPFGGDVTVSLHFTSDVGWSDEDGQFNTHGAWRVDRVQIGSDVDNFDTDDGGWVGLDWTESTLWTEFRLQDYPILNDGDPDWNLAYSWVAYDPGDLEVALAVPGAEYQEIGIVSPPIELWDLFDPDDYDKFILDFTLYRDLPPAAGLAYRWQVISVMPWPCAQTPRSNGYVFVGTTGWQCSRVSDPAAEPYFDIKDHIMPGAQSIRVLLSIVDIRGPSIPGTGAFTEGAYFDNVRLMAAFTPPQPGSSDPYVCTSPNTSTGCAGPPVTPEDASVPRSNPVTVTFTDCVSYAGNTTLSTSGTGPPPPTGFRLGAPATYFEIATDALFDGSVEVCIDYSALSFANESQIRLFHQPGGTGPWQDATSSLDTVNDIICATATSLSPFVIVEPATIEVSGTVVSACQGPLAGVTVDLDLYPEDPNGDMMITTTLADGSFLFSDVPASQTPGEITVVSPPGFSPNDPENGDAEVDLSVNQVVLFTLACPQATGNTRGKGYWKHQANVHLKNKGSAHESEDDMWMNFPFAIFNRFHESALTNIEVEGVTYMDEPSPRPLTLAEIQTTLTVNGGATLYDRTRQHYLVFLLNIASDKIYTHTEVSADHATASQAVQYVAALIGGTDPSGHEEAKNIAEMINEGVEVPAGMVPLDIDFIAYSRPGEEAANRFFLAQNQPNPFASRTAIKFGLPEPDAYTLTILSVTGRLVRRYDGFGDGLVTVAWDGRDNGGTAVAAGVYFYRIQAGEFESTRRMLLAR